MARTLADSLELGCKRVQFTPDLMPADITGTQVLEQDPATNARHFRFKQGPIFTNLLLADEINRTPPKTQAALLEAMQERRVTISGQTYELPAPFFVIATQNPIEQEGTYPLPEAQLDRFMFSVKVAYPNADDEERIIMETTQDLTQNVERVLSAEALIGFQHLVRQTPVSRHVGAYVTRMVRATRARCRRRARLHQELGPLGCGPARGAISDPRRQIKRVAARAAQCLVRRRSRLHAARFAPSRPLQFCRRQRGRRFGRNRAPPCRLRA